MPLFSSPIPRPEYPRPDRQRGMVDGIDWLNLNGPWQFRFDPHRRGLDEKWFAPGGPEWREQIIVPFCWESLAAWGEGSAAGNDNYFSTRVYVDPLTVSRANHREAARHEVGWYRRHIPVPRGPAWDGKRVILTIGAADFFTEAWCNGQSLGRREGGYVPIEFDLTDALDGSTHALVMLRVEDPMDNKEQPVGKQWGWYTPTSGIWQTVFIEPRAAIHLESFRITTDIDAKEVRFDAICIGAGPATIVEADIIPPEAPPYRINLPVQGGHARGVSKVAPLSLWDPGDPKLYHVVFRVSEGRTEVDTVRGYFGMRKISTTPGSAGNSPAQLCLNNRPIYLRGALYQSYHPDGIYTARSVQTLHDDIAFARQAGFDFLRIHIKLDDPLLLYWADKEGMLLMQDFPNFGEGGDTPLGRERFEAMMREGFKRDFNHPSIIAWCLFNETWGFGGQTELMKVIAPALVGKMTRQEAAAKIANSSSFQWVHAMWQQAKAIDPTRLVEDMSVVVWEHLAAYGHVDTDINSWHFYLDDYAKAKAHIADVVAKSHRGSNFNYVEGYQQSDAPLINSEYGGVGALDGDRDISWTFKFLTNELRRHGQLSAYIFTQLHDVEWECNGLLNYDRTPKQLGYPANLVNQGDVLPINAAPICRLAPGTPVEIEVMSSHFSRRPREGVTLHWHYTGVDPLGGIHLELLRGWAGIPFRQNRVELARKLSLVTPSEPMLCTLWVSAIDASGETAASNFVHQLVLREDLPMREERGPTLVLRKRTGDWQTAEWSGGASTKEQAAHRCFGRGTGFFEWVFRDDALRNLGRARRVRVLCEASACRPSIAQTDNHAFPTDFELQLNGLPVHRGILPNHPHDARGALSYLQGQPGDYGYLVKAAIEDDLLQRLAGTVTVDGEMRFRCAVPSDGAFHGGLTVHDFDSGRYPLGPTLIIEWDQDERRISP